MYLIKWDKISENLHEKIKGKSFKEVAEFLNKNRNSQNPVILVGVKRGNRVILNPKEDWEGPKEEKFERFEEGDALIVMAFEYPDLNKYTGLI